MSDTPTMADIEAAASDTPAARPSQQRVVTRDEFILGQAALVKRIMSRAGIKDGAAIERMLSRWQATVA